MLVGPVRFMTRVLGVPTVVLAGPLLGRVLRGGRVTADGRFRRSFSLRARFLRVPIVFVFRYVSTLVVLLEQFNGNVTVSPPNVVK